MAFDKRNDDIAVSGVGATNDTSLNIGGTYIVIDAEEGNSAHYCNHSCEHNTHYTKMDLDCSDVSVAFITALRPIAARDEVTV